MLLQARRNTESIRGYEYTVGDRFLSDVKIIHL